MISVWIEDILRIWIEIVAEWIYVVGAWCWLEWQVWRFGHLGQGNESFFDIVLAFGTGLHVEHVKLHGKFLCLTKLHKIHGSTLLLPDNVSRKSNQSDHGSAMPHLHSSAFPAGNPMMSATLLFTLPLRPPHKRSHAAAPNPLCCPSTSHTDPANTTARYSKAQGSCFGTKSNLLHKSQRNGCSPRASWFVFFCISCQRQKLMTFVKMKMSSPALISSQGKSHDSWHLWKFRFSSAQWITLLKLSRSVMSKTMTPPQFCWQTIKTWHLSKFKLTGPLDICLNCNFRTKSGKLQ